MGRVLVEEAGHLPWGVCPGEYRSLWGTLCLDEQIDTRSRIT